MKSILTRSLIVAGLVAGCLLSVPRLAAEELPSGETVLDRAAAAVSAKADMEKIKTSVVKGKFSVPGLEIPFVEHRAGTDKAHLELTIEGQGTVERGVSGRVAWEKNSITGSRILKEGERAKALREAGVQNEHNWRKHFKKARTVAEEKVEGKPAYKVELTTQDGEVLIAHYDRQSGLLVRQEVTVESPQGKVNVVTVLGDYRKVNGIAYPFTVKILEGPTELVLTLDGVEHNADVPEARFALPADVKRLAELEKKQ